LISGVASRQEAVCGEPTTFGGILGRLGVANGAKLIDRLYDPSVAIPGEVHVLNLTETVPPRQQRTYFNQLLLGLLDSPNNLWSMLALYNGLRASKDSFVTRKVLMPLVGFDFTYPEDKDRLVDRDTRLQVGAPP
jgi:hypothetical protein